MNFLIIFFRNIIKMSWFNRLRNTTSRLATNTLSGARRLASNTLSGARRLASNIIPESVQRRITDFDNWLTRHVGPDQTPQVLDEITESIRTNYPPRQPFEVREGNSALRNFARVYTVDGIEGVDARSFLDCVRENITRVLRNNRGTKVKLIFKCYMERPSNLGETIIKPADFHSDIHINLEGTDEDDIYIIMTERILEKMATFQSLGSGWRLYNIINIELHTVSYIPLRGETWIALPKELANKNAIINMQNKDNKCFLWCVLTALNPKDNHPERIDDENGYKKNEKVRDHCHYTGRYRGAAHNSCNLKYRKPNFTPVVFHNLSGYDGHLFIKNLGFTAGNIDCIPNNEEKYISFTKNTEVGAYMNKKGETKPKYHKIRFIDSFKFMAASLDSLVNNLPEDALNNLKKYYTDDELSLVKRKGVYPYEYMDALERFKEIKLPPKEAFYSKLNNEGISDEDYTHAKKVWKVFKMEHLQDYHNLYNETDVLLLADVFESFRNICIENYKLDPAHYYTAPGLSWDACLKMSDVKLELLTDIDMLLMVEKGIRGGVSMISNRYGKANNKYMGDKFNPSEPSKYIEYLDANNLYGTAMFMKLPTSGFKWMNDKELSVWEKIPCILEVDLEYPKELHDLHNDYPLAPERINCGKVEKLIPNLRDKEKYVIHYKNLKQYLKLGLKLKRIHRGIKFVESEWLKSYIDMNTKLRTKANNNFEKDFFKLMNNSVFGKTMENIRNRVNIKLVNDRDKAKKLTAKPNFKHLNIFCEELIAVHMKKTSLIFNKPVYLGMCILDLSKTIMYDFHHNYIKEKYGNNAKLLFTDTDSLMYEIETGDFYKDISEDVKDRFDTSDYPPNHPSGIPTGCNKKVLGVFKDEAAGRIMEEFVGLRAKLYSYKMFKGEESKKCKGIKKSVVKKSITHEDYKNCLFTGKEQYQRMNVIRSHDHDVYTEEVNKIALCSDDDKRHIIEGQTDTLALWHYRI